MAPFNLNSKYVELNSSKIIAFRNYLVQKKIADEDLQRDEPCHEILKQAFARAQIGPSAYNSLRSYMKEQGGVKKYLQQPIWRICPAIGVATFNKKIQNSVPRESDFQQISVVQTRSIVQELFDSKDVDEELVKKYRALCKLITNAECEQHVPKRQNKTEVIQYLREYIREKSKQEDEGKKNESESDEEENRESDDKRKKGQQQQQQQQQQQERENNRYSSESRADLSELNDIMSKLLSGDHVEFLSYAMAVHNTFLKTYANLQKWDRLLRQQQANREYGTPDHNVSASYASSHGKHDRKSHRRSLPHKH